MVGRFATSPLGKEEHMLRSWIARLISCFAVAGVCLVAAEPASADTVGFAVRTVDTSSAINDINQAETLLGAGPTAGSGVFPVVNFVGQGGDGDFPGGVAFPGVSGEDFAMEAIAAIRVNTPGSYQFVVNSDDGFRLRFNVAPNGSGGSVYSEFTGPRGPGDTVGTPVSLVAGQTFNVRLTYFERGGGDEIELSYRLNGGAEQLVGATNDLTATVVPTPTAIVGGASLLGLLGGVGLVRRFRGGSSA
jgi:hypothetical protein